MERELSHREIEELLGAYALDAVEPDERAAVEAHLRTCSRCRAEVADHREVAAYLAHSGGPAPEGVWARIEAALEEPPPPLRLAPMRAVRPGERLRRALAVAAAVLVGLFGGIVGGRTLGDGKAPRTVGPPEVALQRAIHAAELAPDARRVRLRSADERYVVDAVLLPDGRGFLVDANLPRLAPGRTYQLWAIVDSARISAGVLGPEVRAVAFSLGGIPAGLAITEETGGGVVSSRNPPVVLGLVENA